MSGSPVVCDRGHDSVRVVRDGIKRRGGRERQQWRCVLPDGSFHRFNGALSRTRTEGHTCRECENNIDAHQGPPAPAEFEYLVREIAGALVELGSGHSYTDASKRVRARANHGKTGPARDVINGQTVSDWMADFVPVVAARHAETEWPPVLVVDSTSFWWRDPGSKRKYKLWTLMAAFGYDIEGKRGRLWKLEASPTGDSDAWAEFFASLPGKPESIVTDRGFDITKGVDKHWGKWTSVNLVHHCEHHLAKNAFLAFDSDKLPLNDPIRLAFRKALTSREQWDIFVVEALSRPKALASFKWADANKIMLEAQTTGRPRIPPVYSNSAVEQPLRELRKELLPRAFVMTNRVRLNHLLELMRMKYLRVDSIDDYAADIRIHLDAPGRRPERKYRQTYDTKFDPHTGEEGFNSLWNIESQIAIREYRAGRKARAEATGGAVNSAPEDEFS